VLHGSSATAMSCMLVGVEESWRVLVSGGAITGAGRRGCDAKRVARRETKFARVPHFLEPTQPIKAALFSKEKKKKLSGENILFLYSQIFIIPLLKVELSKST
jgi:hypothetical protein